MSLKADILRAAPSDGQAAIFYLGQESVLILHKGRFLLFDPYLTDSVDRATAGGKVVWKRSYPSPIDPHELDFIDYVFCSHAHGDHTDCETLSAVSKASPKARFLGSQPVADKYASAGISSDRILCVKADQPVELETDLTVTPIPAAHEELHPTEDGSYKELGFIVDMGGIRMYHAGDCCPYDGLIERIQGVDVGLMPINGRDYFRLSQNIIGNFDAPEAIRLAKAAGMSLLIPLHFDLYDVNSVNPAYFVDWLTRIAPEQRFHIFVPGEKYIFEK